MLVFCLAGRKAFHLAGETIQYIYYCMVQKKETQLEQAAQRITYRPKERVTYFRALPVAERAAVFNTLSPQVRQDMLKRLSLGEAVDLLDHLDLRRAHYILSHMEDAGRRTRIIQRLKNDLHAKAEQFLRFHAQASTALFHLNYVFLADRTTIGETAAIIEDHLRNTGKVPVVLAHRDGKVAGEVPVATLVRERNSARLAPYVEPIKTIAYNAAANDITALFAAEPHKTVAVTDNDGSVLGVVYTDDVIDLLGESPAATLYSFAGVEATERPFDSAWKKIRHRYRWLIVNLVTVFLAGGVVALFEDTLAHIVLLAAYLPIVAGMGSNAATQTLAVMVRGIAVGEITLRNSRAALAHEIIAALINGVITGCIVFIVAVALNQNPLLGLVAGVSVVASLLVAGFFGTLFPLLLSRLGKDPATSAGILITTTTDIFGFLVLLGLATLLLL